MSQTDETTRQIAEALAAVMRARRHAAGLSQSDMAERAGIDPKHYQAMESGYVSYRERKPANPQLDKLVKLARGYEVSVPDLMAEVFAVVDTGFQVPPPP